MTWGLSHVSGVTLPRDALPQPSRAPTFHPQNVREPPSTAVSYGAGMCRDSAEPASPRGAG